MTPILIPMPRPRARIALLPIALAAALALPVAASAAADPGTGPLSPALAELARPAVRALPAAAEAEALGVPASGPGSLLREADGKVLVELRLADTGGLDLAPVREAGAEVVAADPALGRATVAVAPAALYALGAVPAVESATAVPAPLVYATRCEGGSVFSEGVSQLHADLARSDHGVDGSGVTVGILSDSYNRATTGVDGKSPIATHASADVASADLPGPGSGCAGQEEAVSVLSDPAPKGSGEVFDEGRAMAQAVHDVAPGAHLAFATALGGELAFAKAIERLAAPTGSGGAGADVIVDDISYLGEPFFQNGPVANAVEKVVGEGVAYVSAAGNNNLFDSAKDEIASWETPGYRDSGSCPSAVAATLEAGRAHCLDFDPGSGVDNTFGITVSAFATLRVDLQWAEPWGGVGTDENAYLLSSGGAVLAEATERNVTTTQKPVELLMWTNSSSSARSVQLVVNRASGGTPRTKLALLQNGSGVTATEYPRSEGGDVVGPTLFGHAGAAGAIAVGATRYSSGVAPESYSSRGPVMHYFGPVASGGPAAALPAPEVLSKPDVTATDCGATTFFATLSGGTWRFCGTSQAAPHVAGVIALMEDAAGGPGVASPAALHSALWASATPLAGFGPCAAGAGLVEADGAVADLLASTPGAPPGCLASASTGSTIVGNSKVTVVPAVEPAPVAPTPAVAPQTSLRRRPPAVVRTTGRTARVVFVLASNESPAKFLCKFDRGRYKPCGRHVARSFGLGSHVFRAKALTAAGLADPTPVTVRFRVVRSR
jgi:hypothetical protein